MRCSVCSGNVLQLEQDAFTGSIAVLFLSVEDSLTFVHNVLNRIEVLVHIEGGETISLLVLVKAAENCWAVIFIKLSCVYV